MAITENQLLSDLKAGKYAPVYLITGEVNYYIDMISDYFETKIIPEEFQAFDQTVLYGRDVDMTIVVSAAKRYPVMAPRQLVLVKEAQDMVWSKDSKDGETGKNDKKREDPLVAYLNNPQPATLLVFCYRHKKLDKRSKVYKAIAAHGVVYDKGRLYDNQLPEWIADYINKHGYSITQRSAVLLSECLGNDLSKISNELDKVFISLPAGAVINDEIIERNIGISKDYNVFELQSAIGARDVVKCNRIVNHFASNPKDYPIQMILPTLYGYFIKIMLYHQQSDKSQAASALKINPFFVKDYALAAQNYSLGKLASCIGYLHDTDLRSKGIRNTGTITDGELLKELVFKIIH